MNEYLTYKEAMEKLHIKTLNTLYKLIANGLLVSNIEGTKRIKNSDIDNFMKDHIINK